MKDRQKLLLHRLTGVGSILSVLCFGLLLHGQNAKSDSYAGGEAAAFDLSWFTIAGGGAMHTTSDGGQYELSGTIGQPDAGAPMLGPAESGYTLTGGFWFPLVPGDADGDGGVTLHDHERFTSCMTDDGEEPAAACASFDSDGDGDVDIQDFAEFQRRFSGS